MPHILVVDDDTDLLELMTLVLEKSRYKVTALPDGEKVLNVVKDVQPDIILMDIYLGNIDGRDISKRLKTSDQFRSIPIILYSAGNIASHTIQDSLADTFIPKPFNNSDILEKLQSFHPHS
jgi:CheY-like chemotaxis protein